MRGDPGSIPGMPRFFVFCLCFGCNCVDVFAFLLFLLKFSVMLVLFFLFKNYHVFVRVFVAVFVVFVVVFGFFVNVGLAVFCCWFVYFRCLV